MGYFDNLGSIKAGVVLADAPWSFKTYSKKDISKCPDAYYECMSLEAIQSLPVNSIVNREGAICVMWCTAPMLREGIATLEAWGFRYVSAGARAKQSSAGTKWAFGTGYAYRSAAEFRILGAVGKPKYKSRSVRNLIVSPVREHSRKPDEMRRNSMGHMWNYSHERRQIIDLAETTK